ncbi:sigma-70 family RNA polymerase sigma factor [Actinomadura xylanilytica]|uniref:sigma-70 family RNA polymerase sigma factor n=1 Tax=Actinomadura xylanilytica TaxID=887459 RepID=UPI00255AB1FC|nr:sigma-70 family RNA polymerase sigma factor [Actinomadura xylanilytica]MDL4773704.1 sigma-70 family RNA polymerase sigma factor [Actinomadura xylanilytica]
MSETASDLAPSESSDAVLISRIRDGDATAYGPLYERHLIAARRLARHLVDGDAAEDAVQETFAKILAVLQRGGGPESGFRPYLLTAIRRTVYDRHRADKRLQHTDQIELFDPGVPFVDPALEGLEKSMIARAFRSLPERWQAVLWHTEIEGAKPAEVAPLLGLTANGVAALAYRAREGLRQAYLQMHLAEPSAAAHPEGAAAAGAAGRVTAELDERCAQTREKLGAYVRGGLAKRESRAVENHLDDCADCKGLILELADINSRLREVLGPLILGSASAAYLGSAQGGLSAGVITWLRHLSKRQQQALGGGMAATVILAAALAMVLVSGNEPIGPVHKAPAIARPAPADPPSQPGPKPPAAQPPAAQPAPPPAATPIQKPLSKPAAPVPAPAPAQPAHKPASKPVPQKPVPQKPKPRTPTAPAPEVPSWLSPEMPPVALPEVPQIVPPWMPNVPLPLVPEPQGRPASPDTLGTLVPDEPEIVGKAVRNSGLGRGKGRTPDAGPSTGPVVGPGAGQSAGHGNGQGIGRGTGPIPVQGIGRIPGRDHGRIPERGIGRLPGRDLGRGIGQVPGRGEPRTGLFP